MKFILGRKIEMTQIFDQEGKVVPVTLIKADPCQVTQIKTEEKDGYESVQIGLEKLKNKKVGKSQRQKPFRYIREFRGDIDISKYKLGQKVDASVFQEGEQLKISGISKGKGFQGGVKRWGFSGKNATHGVKKEHRTIGSVGSMFPQRVIKGRKMPGRAGYQRVTVKNLRVARVDPGNSLIAVKGAIPGHRGTLLEIRSQ